MQIQQGQNDLFVHDQKVGMVRAWMEICMKRRVREKAIDIKSYKRKDIVQK